MISSGLKRPSAPLESSGSPRQSCRWRHAPCPAAGLVGQQAVNPSSTNRSCQHQTVVFDLPEEAMMAWVPSPSAVSRMTGAHQKRFWAASRSEIECFKPLAVRSRNSHENPARMTQIRIDESRQESQFGLFRLGHSTTAQSFARSVTGGSCLPGVAAYNPAF